MSQSEHNPILAALAQLASGAADPTKKVDWTSIDVPVRHDGNQITLPNEPGPMPIPAAITTLKQIEEQENQQFDVTEEIKGAPWDSLVAVYRSMQSIYGVVLSKSQHTFFGEIKPDFVTVKTGPAKKDVVQVPMGKMALPGVSEPVYVQMTSQGVRLFGTVRKRDRAILVEIANRARDFLRTESIYRGRAISLPVDDNGEIIIAQQPEFLDVGRVRESDMIHTDETAAQIRTNILAPLKNTEACRKHKIPLKRGILLEGPYGCGKSLTAQVTAKVATDNGWTFINLGKSQGLKTAIELTRIYGPCVIFAEDIDRNADRNDEDVNDLVNLLDGVTSKHLEMMVVLTTNFVEKIDKALLRPGRFDAIVSIRPPDAAAGEALIRHYAGPLLDPKAELNLVGEAISGWIPATIREVVERAKLAMLVEDRGAISSEDLLVSATGMARHMELLNPPAETETDAERYWKLNQKLVQNAFGGEETEGLAQESTLGQTLRNVGQAIRQIKGVAGMLEAVSPHIQAGAAASEASRKLGERTVKRIGA